MDHLLWPEGSCELGSVRSSVLPSFSLSVFLSRTFLWISVLVFSQTQHGDRDPCGVVCDSWINWKFAPKMEKMGSLYYLLYSFLNPIFGKKLILEIWPKMLLAIRLQDFQINYISRRKWWKSLIFSMLIQMIGKY